jgi:GNAT superfamily N-acetyltransferase
MSERAASTAEPVVAGPAPAPAPGGAASDAVPEWRVRPATPSDTRAIAEAVRALLLELGGRPAEVSAIEEATQALLREPESGVLLVAQGDAGLVGLLGASWQSALHIPGRYGLIQELWVHPSWRGRAVGGDLLEGVFAIARALRIARVEVGLPSDGFAGIRATEAFYRRNGFELLGARMRRTLL